MTMSVLLVEDSRILRDRLRGLVSDIPNVSVAGEADSEESAGQSFSQIQPDVVVLDLRLKSGSGLAVLEQIKSQVPQTVVVVLTNYSQTEYRQKCSRLGADYFFDKSQDIEVFAHLLARLGGEAKHE